MDFVISKVAMAICALLVITVMAGLFTESSLLGGLGYDRVLDEFCDLVERAAMGESSIVWETPFLANGESVTISISKCVVLVESSEGAAARKPACGVHLWRSDGRNLNQSAVAALDEGAGCLTFESGQTVEVTGQLIPFEDEERAFVFVRMPG